MNTNDDLKLLVIIAVILLIRGVQIGGEFDPSMVNR